MIELPQWAHELATLATLAVAAGYLAVHLGRIAKPRVGAGGAKGGCARCEHNAAGPGSVAESRARARRSKRLRVLG